jgi:hypothetical protein
MPILQIEHGVRDYDAWKQAFDSDPVGREEGGVRSYRVLRATDDPNAVVIELEFDGATEAESFREKLRGLWSQRAGELGLENPHARILDVAEEKDY